MKLLLLVPTIVAVAVLAVLGFMRIAELRSDMAALEFGLADLESTVASSVSATKVVAASNSVNRSSADYVGDGFDDQKEIQTAIDAMSDTGGTVLLLEGTYRISAPINLNDRVALRGQGASSILKLADGANSDIVKYVGSNEPTGGSIAIQNLEIDGNRSSQTAPSNGIYVENAYYLTIEAVNIHDVRDYAIYLVSQGGGARMNINNNWISFNGKALYAEPGVRVVNNFFMYNDQGVELRGVLSAFIGNHLQATGYNPETKTSIPSYGLKVIWPYVRIESNSIIGNGAEGIVLSNGAQFAIVEGNVVADNGSAQPDTYAGIKVLSSFSNITGNVIMSEDQGRQKYGILLEGDENHNMITDNIIFFNGTASIWGGDETDLIVDNIVDNLR